MNKYKITWCACPTNYNTKHVMFVEAGSEADAKAIAKDYIERRYGVSWFTIDVTIPAPVPAGRVLEG